MPDHVCVCLYMRVPQACPTLCHPRDYTVPGTLIWQLYCSFQGTSFTSSPAHPARHAPVVALSRVTVSCTDAGHCFHPGLCVSPAPRHRGTSFALRGPRRDPRTDEKTAALQRPLSSSRDSPAGQSGFSRPVQPRPGSLLLGSLFCPSFESHTVGVQEGPRVLDTGSPQRACRWTPVPPQWPCVASSRTASSPSARGLGSADEAGRAVSHTCFSDARGRPVELVLPGGPSS